MIEAPSHLHSHPELLKLTLLAALVYERQREITDTLADLLISMVHRIGARAERRVTLIVTVREQRAEEAQREPGGDLGRVQSTWILP